MYTVMSAARISSGSLASEAWKAWAVPWKLARIEAGRPRSCRALSMACTASPRATPGARLKERVTAGNWPWIDGQGGGGGGKVGECAQGRGGPVGRAHVD